MKVIDTALDGVLLIEPRVFEDSRGFFFESFNALQFEALAGKQIDFVQDNHSRSLGGVIRGLHYQHQHPQGKLVRVVIGEVYDVAVDLRRGSKHFGQWYGARLSAANQHMLWVPAGFAHGFAVLSDSADFLYKTTALWHPGDEYCIRYDDADLDIAWPLTRAPVVSEKDLLGEAFSNARTFD